MATISVQIPDTSSPGQDGEIERLRVQLENELSNARLAGEEVAAASQKLKVTEETLSTMTERWQSLLQEKWQLEQERKSLWGKIEQGTKATDLA